MNQQDRKARRRSSEQITVPMTALDASTVRLFYFVIGRNRRIRIGWCGLAREYRADINGHRTARAHADTISAHTGAKIDDQLDWIPETTEEEET